MTSALLVLALGWAAFALALSLYGRREAAPQERFDAIVVLGCRVLPDGRPSTALAGRTRRAVELWHEGRAPKLVLTGGVGDAPVSEADAAAALARELGVPEAAMVIESRSTSTEENARFAAALLDARAVLLVTDDHHVLRSERVFARYFPRVAGVGTVNPRLLPRIRGSLREVVALAGYAALGRV